MRKILAIWAAISFMAPVYSLLHYPLLKMPTPMAMRTIEEQHINIQSMSIEQKEQYEFMKAWILGNYEGLKRSARTRQLIVSILGILSGSLALFLAIRWKHLTSNSSRPSGAGTSA